MKYALLSFAAACVAVSHAASLVANGDFSRCEKGTPPPECRAEDGVRTSLFTEDLTWNRCLKAEVSRAYTNVADGVVSWSGSAFMGAPGQLGFPVEPLKRYDVSVDLRSEQAVPVKVTVSFWKGECRNWKDRVDTPVVAGAYRPGKDWKTVRGTVRAPEGAKLAAIRLGFSGSTEAGRNKLKVGDWVLADNFTFALSRKNLMEASPSAEIDVPPRKTIATGDATPVSDFRDRKFSVAVLPVVSDYACPFLPEEIFDPPTNISLVAAVNEVKAMPLAVANLTDRLEDFLVMLETEENEYVGDFGLKGFPSGRIKVRRAVRMRDAAGDTPTMRFDPLMPSEEACAVTVPSHEAGLVWFDFDTTDAKPGTYRGRLRIIPLGEEGRTVQRPGGGYHDRDYVGKMQTLPVTLTVDPIELPKRSPIPSGFFMHVPNEEAYNLAADLGAERHQISPWQFPVTGDSTAVVARIANDRAWAAKRGIRPRFDILYSAYTQRLDGLKNPEKANAVWEPYLRNVKRIMNANGVSDEDYWIETADEPKAKDLKTLIAAHRLAKAAVPSVRLCVTIAAWALGEAEMRELAEVTDVFIFWGRGYFTEPWKIKLVEEFRARGGTVCHYMCGTSMRLPLDTYFRHHAWIGERYRLDGNYLYEFSKLIKSFGATDFKEPTAGDLVYYAYGKSIPSVRYCAFREGITDVKYLAALRTVAGDDPEVKAFLESAAKEVLDISPRDPTTPDRLREKTRRLLLKHAK